MTIWSLEKEDFLLLAARTVMCENGKLNILQENVRDENKVN